MGTVTDQSALFPLRPRRRPRTTGSLEEQLAAAGIPTPTFEYRFEPGRKWAFDLAWPGPRIAIEVEGAVFGRVVVVQRGYEKRKGQVIPVTPNTPVRLGGRHNTGAGLQADCEKYNRAAVRGWIVLRVTTTMVRDGQVIEELRRAFTARGWEWT